MHSAERERLILECLKQQGFVSFQDLEGRMKASPATIRRDLARMNDAGLITRVHGGARLATPAKGGAGARGATPAGLLGVPFHENMNRNRRQKVLVGREAAKLVTAGEAVMIDGGS